ncbi:hypothetical protein HanIR_Chr15g0771081 [Helianthus annuus]|nr:hypothetical protein HanIR_Chr15g0771081 [Helianthus annuus]
MVVLNVRWQIRSAIEWWSDVNRRSSGEELRMIVVRCFFYCYHLLSLFFFIKIKILVYFLFVFVFMSNLYLLLIISFILFLFINYYICVCSIL